MDHDSKIYVAGHTGLVGFAFVGKKTDISRPDPPVTHTFTV